MPSKKKIRSTAILVIGAVGIACSAALLVQFIGDEDEIAEREQFLGAPGIPLRDDLLWGTQTRDLYPPIVDPHFLSAAESDQLLEPEDSVYLLESDEGTYVFPEVLLASYHVVNASIAGAPVAVSFCLLAGSASGFSRRLGERTLTLGLTGQLYCGNSILYDAETGTNWLQLNGEPLSGPYFGKARLDATALPRSSWGRVRGREHLRVLGPIREMASYREFQSKMAAERFGARVVDGNTGLDPRLLPYTRGIGIRVRGETCFFPTVSQEEVRMRQNCVGGWALVFVEDPTTETQRVFRRQLGDQVLDFELHGDRMKDRQTGSVWTERGRCVEGPLSGARLEEPRYASVYWFVWSALHAETKIRA